MNLIHVLVDWATPSTCSLIIGSGLLAATALSGWLALKGLVIWLTQD